MEQRKLIKLGNSSFAIALPKDWIDKSGLKKGDSIFLTLSSNGEIVVSSSYQKNNNGKVKILDFSNISDQKVIQREISLSYIQDHSTLEIIGVKDKELMSNIKKQIDYLIGLEIVENSNGKIVAKDYFNLEEANIENFVKRMDNNIREMFDELEQGVNAGKLTAKQFAEIYDADNDVNKFYLLINKLFIKGAGNPSILKTFNTDVLGLFNNWWLSYNIEHVGDEVKRIARFIKQEGLDPEKSKSVSMVLAKVKEAYNNSISSYYRKDKELSLKIISEKDPLIELAETLSMDKNSTVAKTGEKLKIIIGLLHQINKIILYSIVGG